jgi:hypothetical protein
MHRKSSVVDLINWLEAVTDAKKKMPVEDAKKIIECLRKIKLDLDFSLMSYLEFQRFNLSFPLLGVRHPNTHHIDQNDIVDILDMIDKYKKKLRNPNREIVTKDDVDLAHQRLSTAYSDHSLSRSDGLHTIPGYCLVSKREIQFFYYHFIYLNSRLDLIIEQMTENLLN